MCECGLLVDGKCLNCGKKHEKKEKQSLVIWLLKGETLKFESVENLKNNDTELKFDYFGVSTQVKRSAVFNQINIAGFALEE